MLHTVGISLGSRLLKSISTSRVRSRPLWQHFGVQRMLSTTVVDSTSIPGVVSVTRPSERVSDPVIQVGIMTGVQGNDLEQPRLAMEMLIEEAKNGKMQLDAPGTSVHFITGHPTAVAENRTSELYKRFSEPILSGHPSAEEALVAEVDPSGAEHIHDECRRARELEGLLNDLNVFVDLRAASSPPSDPYVKVAGPCTSKHMLVASHFLPFKWDVTSKPRKIRLVHDPNLLLSEGEVKAPDEYVGSSAGVAVVVETGTSTAEVIREQCRHLLQNLVNVSGLDESGPVKAAKWEDWYPVKAMGILLPPKYNMAFLPYGVTKPYKYRGEAWKWSPDHIPMNFGKLNKSTAAGQHIVDGKRGTKYTPRRTTVYFLPPQPPPYAAPKAGDTIFWPLKYFRVAGFNTVGKSIKPRQVPELSSAENDLAARSGDATRDEELESVANLKLASTKANSANKTKVRLAEKMVNEWNTVGFLNMLTDSKMLFKRNMRDKDFTIVDDIESSEAPDFITEDIDFRHTKRPKPVMGERAAPDLMTVLRQYNQYMQQRPTVIGQQPIPIKKSRSVARYTTPEDAPYLLTTHFFHFPNSGKRGNPVVVYPSLFRQEDTIPVRLEKPYKSQSIQFDFQVFRSVMGSRAFLGHLRGEEGSPEQVLQLEIIQDFIKSTPEGMFEHVARPSEKAGGRVVDYIGFVVHPTCTLKWFQVGGSNDKLAEVMVEGQDKDAVGATYVGLAETLLCLNSLREQSERKLTRTFLLFDDRGKNMYPSPMLPLLKDWMLDTDTPSS